MLDDILEGKQALFGNDAVTVLRGHENRTRRVSLLNGDLVTNTRAENRGVNAYVYRNGVYGFASAAEYTSAAAEKVLRAASDNAAFLSARASRETKTFCPVPRKSIPLNGRISDTAQARLIETCKTVDAYIRERHPFLTSRSVTYSEDSQDRMLYTSDACSGHAVTPRCYIYVSLSAETGDGTPAELFKAFGGFGSFDENFGDPSVLFPEIDRLADCLKQKQAGVYPKAGMHTVILSGELAGMLAHEAVGHTVEADLVLGGSVAGPNLNKRVASEMISLTDFAHTAFGKPVPLPVYIDDEGVAAEDADLIRDGILVGYMHSRESAARFGAAPRGNARAWAYKDEPLIRMRNTCILPGKDSLKDMIAGIDQGYYLISTNNGQADLTGEFMFGVTMGYEISHGQLGRALLDTTVSGIAFEMLKTVDAVSDRITWESSGFCGKKQIIPVGLGGPDIRCRIMVGGR